MIYLLDTSIYSQPLKKEPFATVIQHWKEAGDSNCCISVFCEMELLQGIKLSQNKRLETLYHTILRGRIPIIDFSIKEASIYAELQASSVTQGRRRPVIDLCIAATAMAHDCTLATLNGKDFSGIPGLRVVDWSEGTVEA